MLYSGTDPEPYITKYTSAYEDEIVMGVRALAAAGKNTILDVNLAAARKQTVNRPRPVQDKTRQSRFS